MIATVVESYVDVEDVAVFENVLVWYAVTYDFVYRCADGLWEVVVAKRRWV
jgi:hypothetical protein